MDFALLPLYQKQPEKEAEQQIQNSPWRWIILWDNSGFFWGKTDRGWAPSFPESEEWGWPNDWSHSWDLNQLHCSYFFDYLHV